MYKMDMGLVQGMGGCFGRELFLLVLPINS